RLDRFLLDRDRGDARLDVRYVALGDADLALQRREILLGTERRGLALLDLGAREDAPRREVLASEELLPGKLQPLGLQLRLPAQLLELEARLGQPHGVLLGFRAEPLDLGLRPGAGRFRLGAQLPQIHLADISADRIGSGAKLGERGAAVDLL